jgi:mono/diheme cytochrome c family protein
VRSWADRRAVLAVLLLVADGKGLMAADAGAAAASIMRRLGCTSCHLDGSSTPFLYASFETFARTPPPAPTGCVQCHLSNFVAASAPRPAGWLPLPVAMLEHIRRFHAYVAAPALATTVELSDRSGERQRLARFTACGLERFLANPLPRSGGSGQSMFPLEPTRLRKLMQGLAPDLEPCGPTSAAWAVSPDQVERGRVLFDQPRCAACHTGAGPGPRLRFGFPLLGRAYFHARVRHGAGHPRAPPLWQRRWEVKSGSLVATTAGTVVMPAHPDIGDADLDALYAYVSSDASDLPSLVRPAPPSGRIEVPTSIRLSLFREVQTRVFDTSCRHCHGPDPREQSLIESVFGATPGSAPVELPMTRLQLSPSPILRRVLTPGAGCSDSPLLARLKARAAEWTGQPLAGRPRGMPMTLPPVDDHALRLVEVWSAAGCPSDRGDLCEACPPSEAPPR